MRDTSKHDLLRESAAKLLKDYVGNKDVKNAFSAVAYSDENETARLRVHCHRAISGETGRLTVLQRIDMLGSDRKNILRDSFIEVFNDKDVGFEKRNEMLVCLKHLSEGQPQIFCAVAIACLTNTSEHDFIRESAAKLLRDYLENEGVRNAFGLVAHSHGDEATRVRAYCLQAISGNALDLQVSNDTRDRRMSQGSGKADLVLEVAIISTVAVCVVAFISYMMSASVVEGV